MSLVSAIIKGFAKRVIRSGDQQVPKCWNPCLLRMTICSTYPALPNQGASAPKVIFPFCPRTAPSFCSTSSFARCASLTAVELFEWRLRMLELWNAKQQSPKRAALDAGARVRGCRVRGLPPPPRVSEERTQVSLPVLSPSGDE